MNNPWIAPLLGQSIGGYRLDAFRGGGGFGVVFEATNLTTGTQHAVKILTPSTRPEDLAEFDSEGRLLRKANKCSGVITLIDSGEEMLPLEFNGVTVPFPLRFHVLVLASGVLEELVNDPNVLAAVPWQERMSLWRGAVKGVHQLHLKRIAHRDLKSSNCLLMASGATVEVRIADLGRSKDLTLAPTLAPIHYLGGRGDLRYAPPENIWLQGGCTAADFKSADLYGLGSLLIELATGHPMTALAMGPLNEARQASLDDLRYGVRRDLATLRPSFVRAVEQAAYEFPKAIRADGEALLRQLCDPVPMARQPTRRIGKHLVTDEGLEWLIRRADILIKRLAIDARAHRQPSRTDSKWSVS